ncbi:MAG: 3-oxoacyl-[acyl-carrier-protein] reductase [Dehalococcoidales bacterium]|nr:3-oxoacyl-[acyl-carrier-protein] reductase [Dehalococcoidales bacterium]
MINLANKIALVTGSGRGIGKAIALKLSEAGADVVINDINDTAECVAEEIRSTGKNSMAAIANVTSTADVSVMMDNIVAAYGKIDILINNAGITRDQLLLRMTDEEWDSVLNIDLKSVFLCTRAAVKYMLKQRWGRIISISSIVGLAGNPGQANYASAKAGIIGFTRAIAREVAPRGITANAIAPGFIDTDMTQRLKEEQKQELMARIPLGYLGSPKDVANAVTFLASDEAAYITGQVLAVDGGMTMV